MPHGTRVTWLHIANYKINRILKFLQHRIFCRLQVLSDNTNWLQFPERPNSVNTNIYTQQLMRYIAMRCWAADKQPDTINQTLNFVQWGQLPHCTTLGVKQTANMNPFLSVCQSWQPTRSHSDLQRKCHQRSSKCRDPYLDATKAHKWHPLLWQEEVDLYHGCLAGLLKKCVLSQSYWANQTQTKQMQLVHCQPVLVLHDWPSLVSHMSDLNRYQTLAWPR